MLLQGSINRFNLVGVLQYLAQNVTTGVLQVHDFEEHGTIYLVKGRVEGISLPITDERLGMHLLKAGCLSEQQLAEVLMEASALTPDEKRLKPLGQCLVEKGFASEATIREVMRRQTFDLVFELAHWQNGVFAYDESEQVPHFQVGIHSHVEELLLDVQRRIDEGQQARKTRSGTGADVCVACPLDQECSAAVKAKYLKKNICLWREMSAVADDSYDRLLDARQLQPEDTEAVLTASLDWR